MTKKTLTLLFFLYCLSYKSAAQSFYYCDSSNSLGIIDISDGNCRDTNIFLYSERFGDIAFSPDGRVFGTRGKELYDISNGGLILIGEFSGNVNALTCNSEGIIYGASDDGGLHTYSLSSRMFRRIGTMPYLPTGDLTFNGGQLYMASENNRMILVNINNPSASQIFMTINTVDPIESFYSVVTFAVDCDSVVTFALGGFFTPGVGQGTRIYALDLENKTTTLLCTVPIRMFGAASPLEFLASDCELVVDLDLDNSSGALVHDFFADTTCTSPLALTDTDVQVYAQLGKVDSMRIRLYEGVLAPGQEYLTLAGSGSVSVSGSGTTELRLVNTGSATFADFEAAIQALRYVNDAPSAGVRKVGFTAYAGGDSSKVAVAHVPFGFSSAGAGQDTTLAFCAGAAPINLFSTLSGNPASGGTWQPNTAAGNGIFNPAMDSAGIYRYIVSGTCGADTAVVTVNLSAGPVFTLGDDFIICEPDTTTRILEPQNLAPGNYTYQWNDASRNRTQIVQPYNEYWLWVTDEQGCSYRDTLFITRSILGVVGQFNLRVRNPISCNGASDGSLRVIPPARDIQWSNGDTSIFATNLRAGTYTVTATDELGCSISDSFNLTEPPLLEVSTNRSIDSSTCNATATLTATGQGGTAPYNFVWSDSTKTATLVTDSSGIYHVTVTDANGCTAVDSVTVALNAGSAVETRDTVTICKGESHTFNNQTLTQSGIYSDTLQTAGGCDSVIILDLRVLPTDTIQIDSNICNGQRVQIGNQTFTTSGSFEIVLQNENGCDSIITLNISVAQAAMDSLSATVCNGESYTFGNQTLTQSGIYEDTLQAVSGCDSVIRLDLKVLPAVMNTVDTSICKGQSLTIANQTFDTSGTFTFTLLNENGCDSIIVLNLNVTNTVTQTIADTICNGETYTFNNETLTQSGTYRDTFLTTSGCDSIVVLDLVVSPQPTVEIGSYSTFCSRLIQLFTTGNYSQIRWSTDATTDTIAVTPLSLFNTYSVTVSNGGKCTATDSILLENAFGAGSTAWLTTCFDPYAELLINEPVNGLPPYRYAINDLPLQDNPFFDSLMAGEYKIIVEDGAGCQYESDLTIPKADSIFLNLTADTSIRAGQPVTINLQTNAVAPFTVQWSPDNTLNCNNCKSITARPEKTITYAATLTDSNGCNATAQITIEVLRKKDEVSFVPNVFSPNGDGVNDFFTVFAGNEIKQVQVLRVFDRWGNLVYERQNFAPNDEQAGWDGTFNGKAVMQGVYVFYAALEYEDGEAGQVSGEVVLVK